MWNEVLEALLPSLLAAASALITLAVGWVSVTARKKWNIDIEEKHARWLQQAIMNGIRYVVGRATGDKGQPLTIYRDAVVDEVLDYVRGSVPDAYAFLVKDDGVVEKLINATLDRWLNESVRIGPITVLDGRPEASPPVVARAQRPAA